MRIAAIDIGSNSIHMIIAEGKRSGAFHVLDAEKDMVRLGSGTLVKGRLSAAATRRCLEVLRDYRRLATTHKVDKIVAVATSAVREARNGEDFLDRIGREVGIYPRAISGEDEAHLIYLAALHSIHLEGKRALVVDIGGGSVELALGTGGSVETAISEGLGVLRLAESHATSDPLTARHEKRLVEHIDAVMGKRLDALREAGFEVAVGTSGTILSLGAMAHLAETGRRAETLHHISVQAGTIHAVRKKLVAADLRARLRMPAMDHARADIIVPGAILLDEILSRLGVKEIVLSEWALREGILLNYIHGHPKSLARAEAYPDVRRRSVVELAERCLFDEAHCRHTAMLALTLFEATHPFHGLDAEARGLLEHAALLHDIGHHISHLQHHLHSYYLIKNGGLRGFSPEEVEILAQVARYHRQGRPRKKHESFAALSALGRRTVRVLSACLRLADALDRSHRQRVQGIEIRRRGTALKLLLAASADVQLELWGAARRVTLLEDLLGVTIRLERVRAQAPSTRRLSARTG